MRKILTDVKLCTGCQICSLACSFEMEGVFNPRKAKIVIHQALIGITRSIEFTDRCDVHMLSTCRGTSGVPPCTEYCCFAALKLEIGK